MSRRMNTSFENFLAISGFFVTIAMLFSNSLRATAVFALLLAGLIFTYVIEAEGSS